MTDMMDSALAKVIQWVAAGLIAVTGWLIKTRIGEFEKRVDGLVGDIEVIQQRLLEVDKKSMREEAKAESAKESVMRIERDFGKMEASLTKIHTRIDDLKDMLYGVMGNQKK